MKRNSNSMPRTLSGLLACTAILVASASEARSAIVSGVEMRAAVGRPLPSGMIFDWTGQCISLNIAALDEGSCDDMPEVSPEDFDSAAMNADESPFGKPEIAQVAPANDNAADDGDSTTGDGNGYSDYYRFKFGSDTDKQTEAMPVDPQPTENAAEEAKSDEAASTDETAKSEETNGDGETASNDESNSSDETAKSEDATPEESPKTDEVAQDDAAKSENASNDEETAKSDETPKDDSVAAEENRSDANSDESANGNDDSKSDADAAGNMEKYYHYRYESLEGRYGYDANRTDDAKSEGDAKSDDGANSEDASPADDNDEKSADGDSTEDSTENAADDSTADEASESAAFADAMLNVVERCSIEYAARWGMSTSQLSRVMSIVK